MPSKKTTTVVLTPEALQLKGDKLLAFGMKTIFSAGIVWFNGLDTDVQLNLMTLAKANKPLEPSIKAITGDGGNLINSASPSVSVDGMTTVSLDVPDDMKEPLLAFVETLVLQKSKALQSAEPERVRTKTESG